MLSFGDNEKRMDASESNKRLSEMARDQGNFVYTRHAKLQMTARNIANGDVKNVLMRGRICGTPELVNETWRYKVETKKFTVIVAFRSPKTVVIVTTWRN